jgi:ornithine--oxo-acid transaminase
MAPSAIETPAVKATAKGRTQASPYHAASSEAAIAAEHAYAAHNYHPLPVVFARASGTSVWDPEGRHYLDFLSAYSAVNQGHCHPELVKALVDQASRLTLSSRAFYNDVFPKFAEFVTQFFGFDMVLPMNTGAEAVETGIKIARKWGYKVKRIPENEALVLSVENNFHGRTVRNKILRDPFPEKTWLMEGIRSSPPFPCLRTPNRARTMALTCQTLDTKFPEPTSQSSTTTRHLCA